jgi:hypothetical protein
LSLPLTVVGKIWLTEVLLKDVLDQWGNNDKRQTEFVMVADQPKEDESVGENEIVIAENTSPPDKPIVDD